MQTLRVSWTHSFTHTWRVAVYGTQCVFMTVQVTFSTVGTHRVRVTGTWMVLLTHS